jgi:hypothetical protein
MPAYTIHFDNKNCAKDKAKKMNNKADLRKSRTFLGKKPENVELSVILPSNDLRSNLILNNSHIENEILDESMFMSTEQLIQNQRNKKHMFPQRGNRKSLYNTISINDIPKSNYEKELTKRIQMIKQHDSYICISGKAVDTLIKFNQERRGSELSFRSLKSMKKKRDVMQIIEETPVIQTDLIKLIEERGKLFFRYLYFL